MDDIKLFSLHSHWCRCSEIFEAAKEKARYINKFNLQNITGDFDTMLTVFMSFNRLSIAYGLLYVVIEGYKKQA